MTNSLPVVVITGAFGALGRAVAQGFAVRGAQLALLDAAPQPPTVVHEVPGPAPLVFGGVDLTDLEATRRVMAATAMRFGGIDVLVNIAGGFRWEKLENGDPATWDQLSRLAPTAIPAGTAPARPVHRSAQTPLTDRRSLIVRSSRNERSRASCPASCF